MPKQFINPFFCSSFTFYAISLSGISLQMNLRAIEKRFPCNEPSLRGLKTRSKLPILIFGSQSLHRYYLIKYSALALCIVTHYVVIPLLSLLPAIWNYFGNFLILFAMQWIACILSTLVLNSATFRYSGIDLSLYLRSSIFLRFR